jgi:hypothetical protein
LHDLSLTEATVARSVDIWCFLITYSNGNKKSAYRHLKKFRDYIQQNIIPVIKKTYISTLQSSRYKNVSMGSWSPIRWDPRSTLWEPVVYPNKAMECSAVLDNATI